MHLPTPSGASPSSLMPTTTVDVERKFGTHDTVKKKQMMLIEGGAGGSSALGLV